MTTNRRPSPPSERISFGAMVIGAVILLGFALLALYANVQKSRRDKIETVTVTRSATATPTPH